MNERIKQLTEQATDTVEIVNPDTGITHHREFFDKEKFAELIVRECASRVDNILREKKDGGGTMGDEIREHFGVEESRTQPDQEAAAFIAAENKKVASRYGYVPKLHPSEWKD
jgi:hypothetical protein